MLALEYIAMYIIIYVGYYLFVIRRNKEYNPKSCPLEVTYMIRVYKLNMNVINYRKLLRLISLVNAFIVATATMLVTLVNHLLLKFVLGFFLLIPFIFIIYSIIGNYYKKKGMTQDV